jgi:hypothetical protein
MHKANNKLQWNVWSRFFIIYISVLNVNIYLELIIIGTNLFEMFLYPDLQYCIKYIEIKGH